MNTITPVHLVPGSGVIFVDSSDLGPASQPPRQARASSGSDSLSKAVSANITSILEAGGHLSEGKAEVFCLCPQTLVISFLLQTKCWDVDPCLRISSRTTTRRSGRASRMGSPPRWMSTSSSGPWGPSRKCRWWEQIVREYLSDEQLQYYSMDCYFRQYWRDQRLSFKGLKNNANNLVINQLREASFKVQMVIGQIK